MTQFVIANNVNTQLAAAVASTGTTLTLASATNLPTLTSGQVMPLTLNDAATGAFYEIVYVTAISGVTLTVERAQEGTGALNWSLGDYAYCAPTAATVATALGNPNNAFVVAPPTAGNQAVPMSQAAGVVGQSRNLVMSVTAAGASATLTADEIIVETALGGLRYCLPSFNKTINLATTGAGGMDTGAAPVSGYVALYAIYNPATETAALLATNAATKQGNVYGGVNMPSGYAASALLGVWPTNPSGQFVVGNQVGRLFSWVGAFALSSATIVGPLTSLSISGVVPPNAKTISGQLQVSSTSSSAMGISMAADANGTGQQAVGFGSTGVAFANIGNYSLALITPQTIFYKNTSSAGTPTFGIYVDSYTI
jgi:hypothetical protein